MSAHILVVDDRKALAEMLCDDLVAQGFSAELATSGDEALALLDKADAVVTDLRMPGIDGLRLLEAARAQDPNRPVLMMTAYGAVDSAVESIRRGAYHYLQKPFKSDELVIFLRRALAEKSLRHETQSLRTQLRERFSFGGLHAQSAAMQKLIALCERVKDSDAPVLLYGETGTGKSAIARALHGESRRATKPFVTVSCAALPEALLESELFGHVKGAFTGAVAQRPGLFVEANGGTLFLDEIGELALPLQAKLLDVLERSVVRAVGSEKETRIDARVIAATHRDLPALVKAGTFREDLLYRLEVVSLTLPPLRDRREDIAPLAARFLRAAKARHPRSLAETLTSEAQERLRFEECPCKVRQLDHAVERAVIFSEQAVLTAKDFALTQTTNDNFFGEVMPIRELQKRYARWALQKNDGHKTNTAAALDVDAKTLAKWLADED